MRRTEDETDSWKDIFTKCRARFWKKAEDRRTNLSFMHVECSVLEAVVRMLYLMLYLVCCVYRAVHYMLEVLMIGVYAESKIYQEEDGSRACAWSAR